ncbi:MAG: hypothetical protein JRE40_04175 [Deltaproteobacteria bacterium]|nr:hypothetical protein [Deltaproteobacteria bacterium]
MPKTETITFAGRVWREEEMSALLNEIGHNFSDYGEISFDYRIDRTDRVSCAFSTCVLDDPSACGLGETSWLALAVAVRALEEAAK